MTVGRTEGRREGQPALRDMKQGLRSEGPYIEEDVVLSCGAERAGGAVGRRQEPSGYTHTLTAPIFPFDTLPHISTWP